MNSARSFLALDFLRGAAALAVFFCHVRGAAFVEFGALSPAEQTPVTAILFALTRAGHEAVMVFFVLSGFLVGGQVIDRIRQERFDIKTYAIDRVTRIFLPLAPACILTVAIGSLAFGLKPEWLQIWINLAGLNNVFVDTLPKNAPLWSLAYEIWFYIFAGAVGYIISRRSLDPVAVFAVVCAIAVLLASNAWYLLFWCIGAVSIFLLNWRHKRTLAVAGVLVLSLGALLYELAAQSRSFTNVAMLPVFASEAMISLGTALIIPSLCTLEASNMLTRIRRPVLGLSRMSYSLYLVHYPLNCALDLWMKKAADLSLTSIAIFGGRACLVFGGSVIFFCCFEAHTALIRGLLAGQQRTPGRDRFSCSKR